MKKIFLLLPIILIINGCGIFIESVPKNTNKLTDFCGQSAVSADPAAPSLVFLDDCQIKRVFVTQDEYDVYKNGRAIECCE
ncbi:MAG: hypothetical protein V4439_02505 [Patescibacteria group bacterium]